MPLILASASMSRRAMLDAAGVDYAVQPAAIDEAAVNAFVTRLKAGQMRRGAIVANQAFLPEALQAARAHGVGLIRPAHVPTFLDWVASAQTPEPKRA